MFCRSCGKELTGAPEVCMNCGAKPRAGTSYCPECGAPTTPLTEVCTNCGMQVGKAIKRKTWKPIAAGTLCIIVGVICVPIGIFINLFLDLVILVVQGEPGGGGGEFPIAFAVTMGILSVIPAIIAIVGGIYALRRRRWGLALAGSICALIIGIAVGGIGARLSLVPSSSSLAVLPFVVFGLLGLVALIFVILGKREFK